MWRVSARLARCVSLVPAAPGFGRGLFYPPAKTAMAQTSVSVRGICWGDPRRAALELTTVMPFHIVWPSGHVASYVELSTYLERHTDYDRCTVYWSECDPTAEKIELAAPTDLERTAYQLAQELRLDLVHFSDASGCAVSGEIEGTDFEVKRPTLTEGVWGLLQMHEDEHPEPRCPDCLRTYQSSCCDDACAGFPEGSAR